jgi:hypothetical protein
MEGKGCVPDGWRQGLLPLASPVETIKIRTLRTKVEQHSNIYDMAPL